MTDYPYNFEFGGAGVDRHNVNESGLICKCDLLGQRIFGRRVFEGHKVNGLRSLGNLNYSGREKARRPED